MSNLEHYFENLLFHGEDVRGNVNKLALTPDEQQAVEVCAAYVTYTVFNGPEQLRKFLECYDESDYQAWVDEFFWSV